ncbi:unnamed protein product [Caenorhabditis bovis]|uniref:Uncharacterized protein n=1 Tax=Caenorhabditis bovis TaxID=2654633 RepID=A0A8S1FCF0_9PELO|nr:unnamed protein product [Caenorhabditis bovis]
MSQSDESLASAAHAELLNSLKTPEQLAMPPYVAPFLTDRYLQWHAQFNTEIMNFLAQLEKNPDASQIRQLINYIGKRNAIITMFDQSQELKQGLGIRRDATGPLDIRAEFQEPIALPIQCYLKVADQDVNGENLKSDGDENESPIVGSQCVPDKCGTTD